MTLYDTHATRCHESMAQLCQGDEVLQLPNLCPLLVHTIRWPFQTVNRLSMASVRFG